VRDRIIVRDLLVRGIVGINPEERRAKQDVVINLELEVDMRAAAATDEIADAVNYRSVCKRIIEHVESASPFLVEKLAADIAAIVLAEFGVERVRVRVEKPGALRFARSVGVEVERAREDAERPDDG
jgi:FolB domain-containing protein